MNTLDIHWPDLPPSVGVISTLRSGGISTGAYGDAQGREGLNLALHVGDLPDAVLANRARLRAHLPAEPRWLQQVHGATVLDAAGIDDSATADASITSAPGVVCAIMTADCLPVLLTDAHGRHVGAAHAGWRGLAGGVIDNTVAALRAAGADELMAWLGPAIGPTVFEVGDDVRLAFDSLGAAAESAFTARAGVPGKYLADLPQLARRVLNRAGVHAIAGGTHCTVSEPARFYSFRRDRITGRMATLIWIR